MCIRVALCHIVKRKEEASVGTVGGDAMATTRSKTTVHLVHNTLNNLQEADSQREDKLPVCFCAFIWN